MVNFMGKSTWLSQLSDFISFSYVKSRESLNDINGMYNLYLKKETRNL